MIFGNNSPVRPEIPPSSLPIQHPSKPIIRLEKKKIKCLESKKSSRLATKPSEDIIHYVMTCTCMQSVRWPKGVKIVPVWSGRCVQVLRLSRVQHYLATWSPPFCLGQTRVHFTNLVHLLFLSDLNIKKGFFRELLTFKIFLDIIFCWPFLPLKSCRRLNIVKNKK